MTRELDDPRRSLSRGEVERLGLTDEEGIAQFGLLKWLNAVFKGQESRDSSRNRRNRQRSEKALGRKEKRRSWD